jgi:hypothetical protein
VIENPYFGTVLTDLVIDATPRHAVPLWELKHTMAEAPSQDTDVERQQLAALISLTERSEKLAEFWNKTRFDQTTLITVFKRLRALQTISFAYTGMHLSFGKFGRRYCESSQNEMSRPFVVTMSAIAASGIVVREISMPDERKYGAVSIGRLESLSPSLSKFDVAFEHLQVLKLNLRDWRYPDAGFEPPPGRIPFVVRFLSKCSNVQELDLSCFSSFEDDVFLAMAEHCSFLNMKSCTLKLFQVSAADSLFRFLMSTAPALRALSLSHIFLRDEDVTWAEILRRMAQDTNLETLELRNLFTRLGARLTGVIVQSNPELKYILKDYADSLSYSNWGPSWHSESVAYPFIGNANLG